MTHRLLPALVLSFIALLSPLAWATPDTAEQSKGVALGSAGFNDMLAKNIQPGVLTTVQQADGSFQLNNPIQTLQANVTQRGTTFTSTSKEPNKSGAFSVQIARFGRDEHMQVAPSTDVYRDGDNVFHAHEGVTEKFSNTGNGIQQDFIVVAKPEGEGALQVQLTVAGAALTTKDDGFTVSLHNSQRTLTYDRLKVIDANNNTIPARMQLLASNTINIVVDDSAAQYPLTIDPTVGDANWVSMGGLPGADGIVHAMVRSGTDIYIGGSFSLVGDVGANRIAKWNGTTWSALGSGVNSTVLALAVDSSGNVYAGGTFTAAGGVTANNIAKWNGTAWSALGAGMSNYGHVYALAVDSSGNVYAGGGFTTAGGVANTAYIAKWNGSAWSALGSGMNNTVRALALDSGGNLYAGGEFTTAGGTAAMYIAKWNGSVWSALGTGMNNTVRALALDSGGNLYAGGNFTTAGGVAVSRIAKWNGSVWSALGTGMSSFAVLTLAVDSGGNLYAGGYFTTAGGVTVNRIAKWNGSVWSALGTGMNNTVTPQVGVYAFAFDSGGNLYAGGEFTTAGGTAAMYIAKWNGSVWSALGTGMNNAVYALAVDSGDNLYAGGLFTTAGGVPVSNIAKWNGSVWSALGTGVNGGVNGAVYALASDSSGNLYAGGNFFAPTIGIAKWNGSVWSAVGTGMDSEVYALAVDSSGNLYAGGLFFAAGGIAANCIAKWNGSVWSALGTGMNNNYVSALAVDSGGNVYAGGDFTTAGGVAANYIAKWNGSVWSALDTGMDSEVRALVVDSGGNLYAGGQFLTAGGIAANHIAKWNGSVWSALGTGMNSGVAALSFDSGGNLYAGGSFTTAGNKVSVYVAKWLLLDTDSDGLGDQVDTDDDNDGILDINDTFPLDATESVDTDSDGIGNNADDDDDNDGYLDVDEITAGTDPLDAASHPLPVAVLGDTDGDGFGDIVTWNNTTGNGYQYLMSSNNLRLAAPNTGTAFVGLLPSAYTQYALADFNRDGSQDTLLRNNSNGTWALLEYNIGSPGSVAMNVPMSTNLADVFVAAADINGDGYKDVLLRNTSTGVWTVYFLQGDVVLSSSVIAATLLPDWQTAAVADFNGDGKADLLLRSTSTQNWFLYELDGATVLRSGSLSLAGTGWNLAGVGDFNADGIQDVLVRRASDSAWYEYTFNDYASAATTRFKSSGSMGLTPAGAAGLAWSIQALADVDGSGTTDVVLYRSSDRQYFVYGLGGVTGRTIVGATVLPITTNPNWIYQTIADYNGDGKLDFLVRWIPTGSFYTGKSYMYGFGSYTAGAVFSYQGYATSITTDLNAQVVK